MMDFEGGEPTGRAEILNLNQLGVRKAGLPPLLAVALKFTGNAQVP
jgi:hypothetical protein